MSNTSDSSALRPPLPLRRLESDLGTLDLHIADSWGSEVSN